MGATTGARSGAITIGQLSRLTGVNIENIRYFEKVGLLSAPPRTEGGHRSYGTEHVRTLAFIRRGRELDRAPAHLAHGHHRPQGQPRRDLRVAEPIRRVRPAQAGGPLKVPFTARCYPRPAISPRLQIFKEGQ